jgi:hypothetical protein
MLTLFFGVEMKVLLSEYATGEQMMGKCNLDIKLEILDSLI